MRTLAKILLATALALVVSSSASAIVTVTLTQIGGTYDGVGDATGDTLVLDIGYSITGATTVTLIDPAIDLGGTATFVSGSETGVALWSGGGVSLSPLITNTDIVAGPAGQPASQLDGWEKGSTNAAGVPCVYGACTSLGTVTLTLTGAAGVIDTGSILQPTPFGTTINDAGGNDITAGQSLGTFTIVSVVPEPTTASLLGLGLVGLTVAGRRRKN